MTSEPGLKEPSMAFQYCGPV